MITNDRHRVEFLFRSQRKDHRAAGRGCEAGEEVAKNLSGTTGSPMEGASDLRCVSIGNYPAYNL